MIIRRLYELAQRTGLLDGICFESLPVPFVVQCDAAGNYLGVIDLRGRVEIPAKGKQKEPKVKMDNGKILPCPRAHGNAANAGFSRYFVDTLPRVLPFIFPPKSEKPADMAIHSADIRKGAASRASFWKQVEKAAKECPEPSLQAILQLGARLQSDPDLAARLQADLDKLEPLPGSRCALACVVDDGITLTENLRVKEWYQSLFNQINAGREAEMPIGVCQVTGEPSPIPPSHSFQFKGVRGGLGTGTYLVSMDKKAFQSYGLDGTANTQIGLEACKGYALALQALINNAVPASEQSCLVTGEIEEGEENADAGKTIGKTSLEIGDNHFLFWTREPASLSFMDVLETADPAAVTSLLESTYAGKNVSALASNDFYLLVLSANSARLVVRDYLETQLAIIQANLARWFRDLQLMPISTNAEAREYFPLWMLASALAGVDGKSGPLIPDRLMMAALRGDPLPEGVLSAGLGRLRAEGAEGCTRQRLALIKLFLVRRGYPVTESLNPDERHPAYLYGRLLEIFDEIQHAAIPNVNAGVVDKFYGTFSSAPALVFSRLFANAQNHLRKLRNENPGAFFNLEKKLTELVALMPGQTPRGLLSLREQGLFALGFYHEKAQRNHEIASRKKNREAKADEATTAAE